MLRTARASTAQASHGPLVASELLPGPRLPAWKA